MLYQLTIAYARLLTNTHSNWLLDRLGGMIGRVAGTVGMGTACGTNQRKYVDILTGDMRTGRGMKDLEEK